MSVWMKRGLLSLAILGLLAAAPVQAQEGLGNGNASPRAGQVIPGEYIVVLHDDVTNVRGMANELARAYGLQLGHIYSVGLKGFAAKIPDALVAALADDPDVAYVEPDQWAQVVVQTDPTGIQRIGAGSVSGVDNLDIAIGVPLINDLDDYRVDVDMATIDTGIDLDHPDLNVVSDVNCMNESGGGPPWARTVSCVPGGDDDHFHGTHVSGTMAAIDNDFGVVGVAPGARLHAVKVLDQNGSGKYSWVIAGVEYVTANAGTIEVANMSLGGGDSQALCDAIAASVSAGVTYAVAGGNSNADVYNYSPANCDEKYSAGSITVSALGDFDGLAEGLFPAQDDCTGRFVLNDDDVLANFSNWGDGVHVVAPGVCIYSTWNDGGYDTISGTSMASPHVAGAAALLAASGYTDPGLIRQTIIDTGNTDSLAFGGWDDDSGDGSKEPLLDVSDTNTYNPVTVPGPGGGGGNAVPIADAGPDQIVPDSDGLGGEVVTLDGIGSWDSDGTVVNYLWMDGATVLYDGPSSTVVGVLLSDGAHTITLTVTDDLGATNTNTDTNEVTVTVQAPAPAGGGGPLAVDSVAYCGEGGRNSDKHMVSVVAVTDGSGPVANVSVSATITKDGSETLIETVTTDGSGEARFKWKNANSGSYTTTVDTIDGVADGTTDAGVTWPNGIPCS